MIFTTVKKKVEKEELFPNDAVMTLADGKFSLNKKAMELFKFPMNTANVSKLANGYDENNNIILATIDTDDVYTNNVTALNTFSSKLLSERLSKQFGSIVEPQNFMLNIIEVDESNIIYARIGKITDVIKGEVVELITVLETLHADEVAQQEEDIKNSQLSCAEVLPEPPAEVFIQIEESNAVEPVIPESVVKRVINTENW